jgi:CubicO group peptidase (beta-lactamase class C family)
MPEGSHYQQGAHFLVQQPGARLHYSNLAAGLAGYQVERTTCMSLATYSKERLFPSLGMLNSNWLLHDLPLANIVVPYEIEQCVP